MKFKVGDRVVVTKGLENHGIPQGTVCVVEGVHGDESDEFPYELRYLKWVVGDDYLAECELELAEG